MALTYTTIQHHFRKENGLSLNEYALCDMIYHLSTKPSSAVPGWCYMTKNSMGSELGITKQAVLNMIDRLISKSFLLKNEETKYLKTTENWYKVYDLAVGKETLPTVKKIDGDGKETLPEAGKETLPNKYNTNNNKKIDTAKPFFSSLLSESSKIFSESGLSGVFFQKMKQVHNLTEVEVNSHFKAWHEKNDSVGTEFKTKEHLRNSFNRFLTESKRGGGKTVLDVPKRAIGGRLIGG